MSSRAHEHQYIIKDITLISHDGKEYSLDSQFVYFSYEETIFRTAVHGTMMLVESVDYPTMLPMIGEERLRVSFTRTDETSGDELDPIKFNLPIYALHGKLQEGKSGKRQTYSISYCSESAYRNLGRVVSKPFKNVTYSEMVQFIYEDFLKIGNKPIVIEQTENVHDYIIQNQKPVKAMHNICRRATSAEGNGQFYVFFEDRDQFNFVTMKKLMKQDPVRTYYYGIKNLPVSSSGDLGGAVKNLAVDMYSASAVHEGSAGFDILSSALNGEVSTSIMTIDPIRRSYQFKTMDLRGDSAKSGIEKNIGSPSPLEFAANSDLASIAEQNAPKTWTGKSRLFVNPRSTMRVVVGDSGQNTQSYISERDPSVKPYNPEEFYIQREAEKQQFLKNVISVCVPGDPRIKAGVVIRFAFPEKTGFIGEKNPQKLDKYLQGNYVVIGVSHIISKGKYKMNLELMKNTWHSEIKPVDLYKDIF